MKKRILVTGGTGFLGSAMVKRLVREGYRVRVVDNNWRGADRRISDVLKDVEFVEADIRDKEKVVEACRGIDGMFHFAFINGTEYFYSIPDQVLDVAVEGMINILAGCREHQVKEFFLASSSEVYQTPAKIPTDETAALSIPDPLNPRYSYGGGKIICELMALNFGRKMFDRVVVFRPHNVYGPDMGGEHVIPQFALRMTELEKSNEAVVQFPMQGQGTETRAFVYVDDFIDGLMVLLEKGRHMEIYHVGTMDEVSIKSVAEKVARCFEKNIRIVPGPLAKGGTPRRCPDITKLKALGYTPKVSLDQGIRDTVQWYRTHAALVGTESKTR